MAITQLLAYNTRNGGKESIAELEVAIHRGDVEQRYTGIGNAISGIKF
jgi:hypothetical protein